MAQHLDGLEGVFVLDEVPFPKQGEHSVGVQRQYSSALGEKLNCQLAVAVHHVGPRGYCPLALRLYLPGGWLADAGRLDAAGVPAEHRAPVSKAELALRLLDEVRGEGFPGGGVVAALGPGALPQLLDGLEERGLAGVVEAGPDVTVLAGPAGLPVRLADLARRARRLGAVAGLRVRLPPGRSAGGDRPLVALLRRRDGGAADFALTNLSGDAGGATADRLWHALAEARQGRQRLRELGLDHFEGRSWRGFHHHVCLVMVAYGFLLQAGPNGF
jgi:SRSO17 transposase